VKDLGKAGLETLSIILYQGPISRAEIDYIRGVNSNFILRNLLIRGLIERVENPHDQRSFLYKPTLELISYLGLSKILIFQTMKL
jgi:segregation and condensation protein B